jgi:hypothetical protein
MRTPAGKDCSFYYEDYNRGRNLQECRAEKGEGSLRWKPGDCAKCPIPAIQMANASPTLHLELTLKTGFLGFGRKAKVIATCTKHRIEVANPYTGCPKCNAERPGLAIFAEALEKLDDKE